MRDEMGEMGSVDVDDTMHTIEKERGDNEQGEEFDEFEAGAGDDDFGDFDDGFQHPSFSADRTSDTHKVIRTEHVAFPFPSSFVSKSIAKPKPVRRGCPVPRVRIDRN
jgi:hypothetical protein